jgi:hypothetical protein
LGPPTSPSPCLPLDLWANAQVEPMEEEERESVGDPGSGVLQIEEKEDDWEPEHQPMEESIFEEVMAGLQEKETFKSLMVALQDNRTFEIAMGGFRAKISKMYAPIFKQQREVRDWKTAELDRQKMLQIEKEKEVADRRVEMQQNSSEQEWRQMLCLKKDKEEADEVKWRMEKMEEDDDHTPQRNKRGFARPAALTPYGTVLRVSQ